MNQVVIYFITDLIFSCWKKRAGSVSQPMRLADDTHIVEKPEERENIDYYQDLKVEVQKDLEVQR